MLLPPKSIVIAPQSQCFQIVSNDTSPPVIQWNRQEGEFFVLSQIEHYNVIRISFERGEGAEGEGIYL